MAYDGIEPFGEGRADLRMALLASYLITVLTRGKAKVTPSDLLPNFEVDQSSEPEDLSPIMNQLAAAYGKNRSDHD